MKLYGIIGCGGCGRVVMPIARDFIKYIYGSHDVEFVFVVENLDKPKIINGHKVISEKDFLSYNADEKYFNIAIANSQARERIANEMIKSNILPFTIRAQNAVIYDNNEIGDGAILCGFTMITSNVKIGKFFHSNIYSYVEHDCVIGDYVTFAPNVHCNGNIVIEDYAYIGTGAIIKQGTPGKPIVIGKGAVVGMGAVVTKSIPPYTTFIGNPAREMYIKK